MKRLLALAAGILLTVLLIATVSAELNIDPGNKPKDENLSNLQYTTLSKHNKAKLEQAERARMRRETIMSSATDTTSNK